MNILEAGKKALTLIREFSNNGGTIGDAQNADYLLSRNRLADIAQKEIATVKKIAAVHYISQYAIDNLFGKTNGFDVVKHLGSDISYTANGGQSYYLEVAGIATVYVEEEISGVWTILQTINNTVKGQYTAWKSNLTLTSTSNHVRLRFAGAYPYDIRNYALYAYPFPTDGDVQPWRPYVEYVMPDDFYQLNKIVQTANNRQYTNVGQYKWRDRKTLILNIYDIGEYEVHYYRYPTTITAETATDYEFEVDVEAQELIPLYIAGHVIIDENVTIATQMLNEYEKRLSRLDNSDIYSTTTIQTVNGW